MASLRRPCPLNVQSVMLPYSAFYQMQKNVAPSSLFNSISFFCPFWFEEDYASEETLVSLIIQDSRPLAA
ncbi:hypothetical protein HGO34_01750 [Agrobacterium vitis]|uniref:Uncharacterized protein n=1 Tax=Agrobacterium vitis TaxID=373 RepID=A0AAE4WA77_AGRVI|nr:hypothetical protein [Agrobacterium vitis]MCF1498443.1 hypothetical protein [Allorhizobium sp. Av2]MCM2438439.1 hypothetical protein [Agrobacterium vitis]MUZ56179.1 hypothetical protein [Agrobacterium vitis]MVA64684.1 hypothetical protein [Agrobacterium vitis]MVA85655.1 hypothetical protein [Agrobacterium vitis]